MVNQELLDILCCPETKQTLSVADARLIEKINQQIDQKKMRNRSGQVVAQKIDGGLIRKDKSFLYPVRDWIPVLLVDEAIPLDGI